MYPKTTPPTAAEGYFARGVRTLPPFSPRARRVRLGSRARPEEGEMHSTTDETPRREVGAGVPQDLPVSRRRFLELGAAWAVGLAAFVAAGCGGEEEEDEGGGEDDD